MRAEQISTLCAILSISLSIILNYYMLFPPGLLLLQQASRHGHVLMIQLPHGTFLLLSPLSLYSDPKLGNLSPAYLYSAKL